MKKLIAITLGAATLSFMPALAHAEEGSSGQTGPVDVEVYPPQVGVQPPTGVPSPAVPAAPVAPSSGALPASGTDSTTMFLQIGSLLLVAGGIAVVGTHRRRAAAAPA